MDSEKLKAHPPRVEPLEILVEASEIVAGRALVLDDLLASLAELTRKIIEYQLFAVLLRSGEDSLRIRFSIGYRDELVRHLRLKIGEGIAGAAAQTRRTVIVNDVSRDDRYLMASDAVRSEMAVPLVARNRLVGVIDLQSTKLHAFGEYEKNLLELLGSRFSLAIEAARLYRSTLRQNRTLRTLAAIAHEFSNILQLEELLNKICSLVRVLIPYDAFSILLLEKDQSLLKHYFGIRFDQRTQWESMPVGKGIVGAAAQTAQPVLVSDTLQDARYVAAIEGIRSEVAVPLSLKNQVIGVIDLESEAVGAFTKDHVRTLSLLAPQIASAIENARLYEQVARNQERMERDLTAAREFQSYLLPSGCSNCPGMEIAPRNDPAAELTGDVYDFIPYPGNQLGIFCGDVSGKGAAAALYGALASGLLRSFVQPGQSPAVILEAASRALLERRMGTRYLTALFAKWYPKERKMMIANAGQPRPILRRGDKVEVLPLSGIPLGLLEGSSYEQMELQLAPGDLLVMVSDGITETEDPARRQYGEERLPQLIESHLAASAPELIELIFRDLHDFSGGREQDDDRTAIVARVTG